AAKVNKVAQTAVQWTASAINQEAPAATTLTNTWSYDDVPAFREAPPGMISDACAMILNHFRISGLCSKSTVFSARRHWSRAVMNNFIPWTDGAARTGLTKSA